MRRWVAVGVACVALLAGCSSSTGSAPAAATPTTGAASPHVSIAPLPAPSTTAQCTDALGYVTAEDRFNADHAHDGGPVVAFLGDSYTAGEGAADVSGSWAALLAKQEGWRPVLLGFPSTGIHNGGVCGGRYFAARLGSVVEAKPDALVIQGGLNDVGLTADGERTDLHTLLADVKADLPGVPVALVGPVSPRADTDTGVRTVTGALASAAGVTFVDGSGWFTSANRPQMVGPDGNHPTPAGHAFLAAQTAAALGQWPTAGR